MSATWKNLYQKTKQIVKIAYQCKVLSYFYYMKDRNKLKFTIYLKNLLAESNFIQIQVAYFKKCGYKNKIRTISNQLVSQH